MLRFDPLGEVRVSFAGTPPALAEAAGIVASCTLPLVVHDYRRAAVLGTATLIMAGNRPVLLTAAHVFEGGVRFGNLLVPLAAGHGLVPLSGARLTARPEVDIAVIDIARVPAAAGLLDGRQVPVAHRAAAPEAAMRHRRARRGRAAAERHVLVSGYPACLARFEQGWLAAKRLTVVTRRRDDAAERRGRADRLFDYGRIGDRSDGVAIHTPELEGMSGAAIWRCESSGRERRLALEAVQSAYVHGRYLRGHAIAAAFDLLHR